MGQSCLPMQSIIFGAKETNKSQQPGQGHFVLRCKESGAFSPAFGGISVQGRLWPQLPSLIKNETDQEGNH